MKSIANIISIGRMILAVLLIWTEPLSLFFYIIYILCGISDIFDGYIARKRGSTSRLGARLDSIADLIMIVVLSIMLYPIITPTSHMLVWGVIIGIIRVISIMVVFKKYRTFAILHTYGNKITGFALFLLPLSLTFVRSDILIYVACAIATLSALEELYIHLTANELEINKKSVFFD